MSQRTDVIILTAMHLHGEAWSLLLVQEAFLRVRGHTPDLDQAAEWLDPEARTAILVDELRPQLTDVEKVSEALPQAGLLFLLATFDLETMVSFIEKGAIGFAARDQETASLVRALIAVGRGELALPSEMAGQILQRLAQGGELDSVERESLTEREGDVLTCLASGMTNKEIAQELMISVRTVEAHLRSVYGKLEVTSRTEAALWAVRHHFESK